MIEMDLLVRVAVAFLKDIDLDEFQRLVNQTSFLVTDINSFCSDEIPQDSIQHSTQGQTTQGRDKKHYKKDILSPEFAIHSPRFEAEILLSFVLNVERVSLHINPKKEVNDFNKQRYFRLLAMRKSGVPLEYLMNKAEFYALRFYVDKNVLIPRSESEMLVDKAMEIMAGEGIDMFVEVGVGSGAISIAILKNMSNASCVASDISLKALNVAKHNAEMLDVKNRIEFIESNLLESRELREAMGVDCDVFNTFKIGGDSGFRSDFDSKGDFGRADSSGARGQKIRLLIANPPYIANNYPLNKEVLCEPKIALFGGERGDEILKDLIAQARECGIEHLICEIGYDQRAGLESYLSELGYKAEFYTDYAGLDRGFVARADF